MNKFVRLVKVLLVIICTAVPTHLIVKSLVSTPTQASASMQWPVSCFLFNYGFLSESYNAATKTATTSWDLQCSSGTSNGCRGRIVITVWWSETDTDQWGAIQQICQDINMNCGAWPDSTDTSVTINQTTPGDYKIMYRVFDAPCDSNGGNLIGSHDQYFTIP